MVVRAGHDYSGRAIVQGLTLWSKIHLAGVWCLPNVPLGCVVLGGDKWYSSWVQWWPLAVPPPEPSGRGCTAGQVQPQPMSTHCHIV